MFIASFSCWVLFLNCTSIKGPVYMRRNIPPSRDNFQLALGNICRDEITSFGAFFENIWRTLFQNGCFQLGREETWQVALFLLHMSSCFSTVCSVSRLELATISNNSFAMYPSILTTLRWKKNPAKSKMMMIGDDEGSSRFSKSFRTATTVVSSG